MIIQRVEMLYSKKDMKIMLMVFCGTEGERTEKIQILPGKDEILNLNKFTLFYIFKNVSFSFKWPAETE